MRVRPFAWICAASFAVCAQFAPAKDDGFVVFDDLREACGKSWELCNQACFGRQPCTSGCDDALLACVTSIDEAEASRSVVRPPSYVRTGAGLCLDVHAPQIAANGGRVQAWACNGQPQQRWTYYPAQRALHVTSGLCLDVHAPQIRTNGGRVQVWTCNGAPQQQWIAMKNGALRNAAGLCLDVHAADQARNGARVQVWRCNGAQQQRFRFEPAPAGPRAVGPALPSTN